MQAYPMPVPCFVASAFVEKGYAATTILKRKECITS